MNKSRREAAGRAIDDNWFPSGNSAVALCEIIQKRIEEVNGRLGALTDVLHESAALEARNVDAMAAKGLSAGRLAGWPIAIKDNIDTVPARCSAGLSFLDDRRPTMDAEAVTLLRREGAVIVGVAYTDSGAFGVISPEVINPNYPDRIVGGSSGGSAAAVAAGLCVAALGTDTGGSVRIPAACCGIVGFKPTKNRVSTEGVRPLATSFDHVGVLSDSVKRVRKVIEVIDPLFNDLPHGLGGPTGQVIVGIPTNFFLDANDEVLQQMAFAIDRLKNMEVVVKEVFLEPPDKIVQSHLVLALTEATLAYGQADEAQEISQYPDTAKQGILLGRSYSASEHLLAMRHSRIFTAQIDSVLETVDFLMLPTLPISPPDRGVSSVTLGGRELNLLNALIRYTAVFDQTGHPVIALPVFDKACSGPGSVQVVGKMNRDRQLLNFAEQLEDLEKMSCDTSI